MPKFDSQAEAPIYQLLDGDYPFEVVAVDNGISTGAKTRGSEVREVKLKFFTDTTFTKPMAQWTEDFINFETSLWKWSTFAKCVGAPLVHGEDFDITAAWIGLRGWATCRPHLPESEKTKKAEEQKRYNRVAAFITNKGKLERAPVAQTPPEDDIPF